jgi:hypothetical protein
VKLRAFRTDRGGEFNSLEFVTFYEEAGIRRNTTSPYSPQQDGIVEKRNQMVVEMARSLMKSMGLPATFWAKAVKTAVHILNRSPTRSLKGMTPYEAWRNKKPRVDYLRTFGCVAHMKIFGPGLTKLSDRARSGVFVGYEDRAKAYRMFDPTSNRLNVTRDVVFKEGRKWDWSDPAAVDDALHRFTVVYSYETESDFNTVRGHGPEHAQSTPDPLSPPRSLAPMVSPTSPVMDTSSEASSSSSPQAAEQPVLPTHPMRTSAQSGIFMPNPKYTGELELSELCLSAAEEPASVDEALEQAP